MTRTLTLVRETLNDLTTEELGHVVGGAMPSGVTCPLKYCLNSDQNCLFPTHPTSTRVTTRPTSRRLTRWSMHHGEHDVHENRNSHSRLDPRLPLVIDTRELGRRPGSQRKVELRVPAPGELGVGMIGVPPGAQLDLRLRLEAVMEGVLVSGTAYAPLTGECGRCLDPIASDIEVDLQELYAYPDSEATEDEADRLHGDLLDLEPALRDAVVLALPLTPLCRENCGGLCVVCGARRDDVDCGHDTAPVDPRWAALNDLAATDAVTDEEQE